MFVCPLFILPCMPISLFVIRARCHGIVTLRLECCLSLSLSCDRPQTLQPRGPDTSRHVKVVLLSGHKLDVVCDPSATGKQLLEGVVRYLTVSDQSLFALTVIHGECLIKVMPLLYSSPPLIRTPLLPKYSVFLSERCPLVRGNTTCIHSTYCQKCVSFIDGCHLSSDL